MYKVLFGCQHRSINTRRLHIFNCCAIIVMSPWLDDSLMLLGERRNLNILMGFPSAAISKSLQKRLHVLFKPKEIKYWYISKNSIYFFSLVRITVYPSGKRDMGWRLHLRQQANRRPCRNACIEYPNWRQKFGTSERFGRAASIYQRWSV